MTAQLSDFCLYRGKHHDLTGKKGEGLFDPTDHGLQPGGWTTACYRGFVCTYSVDHAGLWLHRLQVDHYGDPPVLFGRPPLRAEPLQPVGGLVYEELAYRVPFTGGLLLGEGFITELYVHFGFHPAWRYREIHELIFDQGSLVESSDRSADAAELREAMREQTPMDSLSRGLREHIEQLRSYEPVHSL